jgi:hypothetical protein
MKRDMGLVRHLLLEIEEKAAHPPRSIISFEINGFAYFLCSRIYAIISKNN